MRRVFTVLQLVFRTSVRYQCDAVIDLVAVIDCVLCQPFTPSLTLSSYILSSSSCGVWRLLIFAPPLDPFSALFHSVLVPGV